MGQDFRFDFEKNYRNPRIGKKCNHLNGNFESCVFDRGGWDGRYDLYGERSPK